MRDKPFDSSSHLSDTVGVGAAAATPSLATLLTRNVLQDGEIILLILKPSLWFIVFSSMRFAAVIVLLLVIARVLPGPDAAVMQIGVLLVIGRVMWAVLQWMSRLYILTDRRIIRLQGVFTVDVFESPLRKVARTRLIFSLRERLAGLGSIEIIPEDNSLPVGGWQTINHPAEVHEKVVATINRAKQCGRACPSA